MLAVVEAGIGFGFMAIVIGYLPVLYQAFSRRERSIALLDARAGSPPTAGELLRRSGNPAQCAEIERFLAEWEVWAAELLESHLSYPRAQLLSLAARQPVLAGGAGRRCWMFRPS